MKLFTIGYGGRGKQEFLELVRAHGVRTIVDVRLRPDRASMGLWVKAKDDDRGLQGWLAAAGIGYRSLVELGNVFRDRADWEARYCRLLASSGDLLTEPLAAIEGPLCLLCAEKRAAGCHRRLIAEWLAAHAGAEVQHIE